MEIGLKIMAQTSNNLNILSNQKLSIQISLSGLSFCVLNSDTNTITFLKHLPIGSKKNPFEILEILKNAFASFPILNSEFESVQVIHENELSTLIPNSLFDEEDLADYLKFNSKILKSDFIAYDAIDANESKNIYVPYVNINNFIYEQFGAFSYKHSSTILIEQILRLEKNAEDTKMYVHVSSSHFEIIVTKAGQLILYNTFDYNTKEDFIYYILFTAEQLKLNPESLLLIFLGDITKDDDLYTITYKYIRNVSFGNRYDNYTYMEAPKTSHSDFTLIQSL
jgi:hypothetical protein